MTTTLRRLATALLLALGLAAVAGCSSRPSEPSAAAAAPEDQRAGAAQVAAGLRKIDRLAKDIAGTHNAAEARALIDQIEPTWQQIEGTVKANDQDAYLAMEDSFALLEKAADRDAGSAAKGAGTVAATVAAYLAKYRG